MVTMCMSELELGTFHMHVSCTIFKAISLDKEIMTKFNVFQLEELQPMMN